MRKLLVNKSNIIDITEATKDFSKVVQLVDQRGVAGILKNGTHFNEILLQI